MVKNKTGPGDNKAKEGRSLLKQIGRTFIVWVILCSLYWLVYQGPLKWWIFKEFEEPWGFFFVGIPFVIILLFSGKIEELAFGGFKVKLAKIFKRELVIPKIDVRPFDIIDKLEADKPVARFVPHGISFILGRTDNDEKILKTLRRFSGSPGFQVIVFNDDRGVFKGFMRLNDFRLLFVPEDRSYDIYYGVSEKIRTERILNEPSLIKDSVKSGSTYEDALNRMDDVGVEELAIVSPDGRFIGVIAQTEIERKLLKVLIGITK